MSILKMILIKPLLLWLHRTSYAVKETFRIAGPLVVAVILICGILLSVVLLQGMADGLCQQQERDVQKSPTSIEVAITASRTSQSLTPELVRELESRPGVQLVIEDITKVVDFKSRTAERTGVTVRATKSGDPLLAFYQADVLKPGEKGIVINSALADALGIKYRVDKNRVVADRGQKLTMVVTRQEAKATVQATIDLPIVAVAAIEGKTPLAFLDRSVLDHVEDYQMGRRVDVFGWPGYAKSAPVRYAEYLMFSKEPVGRMDQMKLKANGLTAKALEAGDPKTELRRTLGGTLNAHQFEVHSLSIDSTNGQKLVARPTDEIESITDVDDVIVGWSEPIELASSQTTLVGLTVNKRWLKNSFIDPDLPFMANSGELSIKSIGSGLAHVDDLDLPVGDSTVTLTVAHPQAQAPASNANSQAPALQAPLQGTISTLQRNFPQIFGTPVTQVSASAPVQVTALKPVQPGPFTAVVPASLLSHLHAVERGEVEFDPASKLFVEKSGVNACFQARVIAEDIHAVPAVDDMLLADGFATQSQRVRVRELQGYAETLRKLVLVSGGILGISGLLTLMMKFWDETNRKKRFIAELLTMGATPPTILYVFLLRGLLIGAVAGLVTAGVAPVIASLITQHVALCTIDPSRLPLIFLASLAASAIGSLIPGIRASMIEPAELIRESTGA